MAAVSAVTVAAEVRVFVILMSLMYQPSSASMGFQARACCMVIALDTSMEVVTKRRRILRPR